MEKFIHTDMQKKLLLRHMHYVSYLPYPFTLIISFKKLSKTSSFLYIKQNNTVP